MGYCTTARPCSRVRNCEPRHVTVVYAFEKHGSAPGRGAGLREPKKQKDRLSLCPCCLVHSGGFVCWMYSARDSTLRFPALDSAHSLAERRAPKPKIATMKRTKRKGESVRIKKKVDIRESERERERTVAVWSSLCLVGLGLVFYTLQILDVCRFGWTLVKAGWIACL